MKNEVKKKSEAKPDQKLASDDFSVPFCALPFLQTSTANRDENLPIRFTLCSCGCARSQKNYLFQQEAKKQSGDRIMEGVSHHSGP